MRPCIYAPLPAQVSWLNGGAVIDTSVWPERSLRRPGDHKRPTLGTLALFDGIGLDIVYRPSDVGGRVQIALPEFGSPRGGRTAARDGKPGEWVTAGFGQLGRGFGFQMGHDPFNQPIATSDDEMNVLGQDRACEDPITLLGYGGGEALGAPRA